ncbi:hypothetical protein [Archaeoglobus fulgidus]|uniref:hypothetical protein n=1 Tax=Archaeoglobus fulgidus TaxID=2234 RepID=UPI003557CD1F
MRDALGIKPGTVMNVHLEGKKIILEPSPEPPDIFVDLGERSEQILKESRKIDEERMRKLLRDLGVEGGD